MLAGVVSLIIFIQIYCMELHLNFWCLAWRIRYIPVYLKILIYIIVVPLISFITNIIFVWVKMILVQRNSIIFVVSYVVSSLLVRTWVQSDYCVSLLIEVLMGSRYWRVVLLLVNLRSKYLIRILCKIWSWFDLRNFDL